jgi:hypothetical protein
MSAKPSPEKLQEMQLEVPWYVNDTLSPDARAEIEAAAKLDETLRRNLELAREDQEMTFGLGAACGAPSAHVLDRVLAATAATGRSKIHDAKASLMTRLGSLVASMAPRTLAMAGAAAAILVVVQAAAIGWMAIDRRDGQTIELASGGQERGDMALIIAVRFAEGSRFDDVAALLEARGLVVVDGPMAGRLFVVGLPKDSGPTSTPEDTVKYLLAATKLVQFASPLTPEEN